MVVTVVVLFRGQLAYYQVNEEKERYWAELVKYNGSGETPPKLVSFKKHGRHCLGTAKVELMDDLWDAVEDTKEGTGLLRVIYRNEL